MEWWQVSGVVLSKQEHPQIPRYVGLSSCCLMTHSFGPILDGYFLCQLSASYGNSSAPPGQKLSHMIDAIGAIGSFHISNGQVCRGRFTHSVTLHIAVTQSTSLFKFRWCSRRSTTRPDLIRSGNSMIGIWASQMYRGLDGPTTTWRPCPDGNRSFFSNFHRGSKHAKNPMRSDSDQSRLCPFSSKSWLLEGWKSNTGRHGGTVLDRLWDRRMIFFIKKFVAPIIADRIKILHFYFIGEQLKQFQAVQIHRRERHIRCSTTNNDTNFYGNSRKKRHRWDHLGILFGNEFWGTAIRTGCGFLEKK